MTPNEILARLRAERQRARLSLQALADQHGAHQATVRSHESGERAFTLATLVEHASWFGLEVVLRPAASSEPDAYQRGYDQAVTDACGAWGVRTDDLDEQRSAVDWNTVLPDAYDEIDQEEAT